MRARPKDLLAYILFSICLSFALYSWRNYYATERYVISAIVAVAPTHEQMTADIVASMLPLDGNGPVAREVLTSQVKYVEWLHDAWLHQATAYRDFARNQLIMWAMAATGALSLVVTLYREARGAR